MDDVDRAQALEEAQRAAALSRRRPSGPALEWPRQCVDCDEWLTRARVEAAPFARRCVDCQQEAERRLK